MNGDAVESDVDMRTETNGEQFQSKIKHGRCCNSTLSFGTTCFIILWLDFSAMILTELDVFCLSPVVIIQYNDGDLGLTFVITPAMMN